MEDATVAVVENHLYESILVANKGGVIVDVKAHTMIDGIATMVEMLRDDRIDGFILDRYTLVLLYAFFSDVNSSHSKSVDFIKSKRI